MESELATVEEDLSAGDDKSRCIRRDWHAIRSSDCFGAAGGDLSQDNNPDRLVGR